MALQPPFTFIAPMDDSLMVSASGDSLPNGSTTSSEPDRRYPLCERYPPDRYHKQLYIHVYTFIFILV